jgi:cardiolipin synthase
MHLPAADIARLADAAASGVGRLATLRSQAASPVLREACDRLIALSGVSGDYLAGLLFGASAAVEQAGADQQVDIVWTGPDSGIQTGRLTAPTVTELIDSAAAELILVTFASQDEPRLADAVGAAVGRGVDITVLFERNDDNPSYTQRGDVFSDLPVRRWVWPKDRRPTGAALHAKIVVVDRRTALLGSANLTGRALTANLECGVLLRGGPYPAAIHDHLWSLRYRGVLSEA